MAAICCNFNCCNRWSSCWLGWISQRRSCVGWYLRLRVVEAVDVDEVSWLACTLKIKEITIIVLTYYYFFSSVIWIFPGYWGLKKWILTILSILWTSEATMGWIYFWSRSNIHCSPRQNGKKKISTSKKWKK